MAATTTPWPNDHDHRVRVADYLDDRLQNLADLDTLDAIISNVRNQHVLLKKQLEEAESDLQHAKEASQSHDRTLRENARQFQKEQDGIDRRLRAIIQSDSSDDATLQLQSVLSKQHILDVTSAYFELLNEVENLSRESISQLGKSDEAAVESYRQLQLLVTKAVPLQDAAEGAAPQLLYHIREITDDLRNRIQAAFASDLDAILKKIFWPKKDVVLTGKLREEWSRSVGKLLDLQKQDLEEREHEVSSSRNFERRPIVLLPLEVLARPLEVRFKYHFDGDRPTNRLDKPEYFLSHITDLIDQYSPFLQDSLQPVLIEHFKGSDLAMNPIYIDATSAFITALLSILRTKVFSTLPKVGNEPQLLSHFIHELLSFDSTIRDEWKYDGGYGAIGWKGLSWEVLQEDNSIWFRRWLEVEKNFALKRYEDILSAPDAGELDYDSVDANVTKPSKAAIRVNDLLETVTEHYRPLSSFSQKIRFLIDIQIAIFDQYFNRLSSGLEAYLSMTTAIGRRVTGISKEEQLELQGIKGLDRLCRVYGSADYLERAMRDWSDDLFFLELWDELQDRARNSSRNNQNISRNLNLEEVAEKTSSSLGSDEDTGALFDSTATAYKGLRIRTEKIIVDNLAYNVAEALRPYRSSNPWSTLTTPPSTATSANLDPLLKYLNDTFKFLSRALGQVPLRRIARQVCGSVQTYLWDQVLMRHSFSTAGAAQLRTDLDAVVATIERHVGKGSAETGMRRVREGVRLIGLPIIAKSGDSSSRDIDELEGQGKVFGLWEVNNKVMKDNESARQILEEMSIEDLTESDARAVLERRIELGS
ncbi:hypothetical protein M501DRAFT_941214 [Patellaria atrata CBS 101060]|uniref:RINT-1 family protein n=1 Tax=Patellaria atrata CBS 101060 TaxID=1346257 RepID=A0A9P4VPW4_9PEZI|nr:hypothetical protein M501DRAFT_941214 [Patellaria atrata CBS 101060]